MCVSTYQNYGAEVCVGDVEAAGELGDEKDHIPCFADYAFLFYDWKYVFDCVLESTGVSRRHIFSLSLSLSIYLSLSLFLSLSNQEVVKEGCEIGNYVILRFFEGLWAHYCGLGS